MPLPALQRQLPEALEPERVEGVQNASGEEKDRYVTVMIRTSSATAAVSALQPVPGLDVAILTPLQRQLVRSIGVVRGCRMDDEHLDRLFHGIRAPVVTSHVVLAATKLLRWFPLPVLPQNLVPELFAASLAYAITFAVGQVGDEYFRQDGMPAKELEPRFERISKKHFADALRAKRKELRALFRDGEARQRVKDLRKEHQAGKIDEAEVARRLDCMLSR